MQMASDESKEMRGLAAATAIQSSLDTHHRPMAPGEREQARGSETNHPSVGDDQRHYLTRVDGQTGGFVDGLVGWMRTLGYRSLLYSLRLRGRFPGNLRRAPARLWPGNETEGKAITVGHFAWAGYTQKDHDEPFTDREAPDAFLAYLHSFAWLDHLAAASQGEAFRAVAEPLCRLWLRDFSAVHSLAWRPDITGARIINWCYHAEYMAPTKDLILRSAVVTSIARQCRHLDRSAFRAAPGFPRFTALAGRVFGHLFLSSAGGALDHAEAAFARECLRFIAHDGGTMARHPHEALQSLRLLISLRAAYRQYQRECPADWQLAIDRLVPYVRGLRMGDGTFSRVFGGAPVAAKAIDITLDLAEADGAPLSNGAHSGVQRIAAGQTILIADAGPPPPPHVCAGAHSGTLAIEMSDGDHPLILNCGAGPLGRPLARDLAWMARSTAAHSTLSIDNTNSAQVRSNGSIGQAPRVVSIDRRESDQGTWLDMDHDGYGKRFGLIHRRRLYLSSDGCDLRGEDQLGPLSWRQRGGPPWKQLVHRLRGHAGRRFDIRFHLDPR
ncbi:MAG: heparinase II/III family protein, partial [Pseudomonadota bacterium]